MTELSLHILDIAYNSVAADSRLITIEIETERTADRLTIRIADDGCGMDEALLQRVTDPFSTTRTTRRVGMGIPLFKAAAEEAGGGFTIKSEKGKGTVTEAWFILSHIDRMPLGDLAGTLVTLLGGCGSAEVRLRLSADNREYVFDTREIKAVLGDDITDQTTLSYLKDMIEENSREIFEGENI